MRTIALSNMKGGVGKTSLAVSLAAEFAKTSRTVLLDFDQQANSTSWTLPDTESAGEGGELADVLRGDTPIGAAIVPTDTTGLYLLPTFIDGQLRSYAENAGELQIIKAVKDLITALGKEYKYCVIDLSPAYGKLERAALIAASETITPILADRFSLDGLEAITSNLAELQSLVSGPIATYKRLVINGINRSIKRHADITDKIKARAKQTVYTVPIDQVFFRAQTSSMTIQDMGDAKPETLETISQIAADIREGR